MVRPLVLVLSLATTSCCFGDPMPAEPPPPIATAPIVTAPVATPTTMEIGTPVLAAWHARRFWFVGVIVGTEGSNLRVMFADGTSEALPATAVMPDRLGPPMAIDARQSPDADFEHATLVERVGHAARVRREDGSETWVAIGHVRVDSEGGPPAGVDPPPVVAARSGEVGSVVLARYPDGYLYSAVVVDASPSGAPRVVYADGEAQETTRDAIFPDTLTTGSVVEVRDRASETVVSGVVMRRVLHAIEVRLPDGSSRWFALADARMPTPT